MPFSEQVKIEVKEKAAFRCCRCQQIGVDVHHITPEKDSGSDDISNAAPLCPSCHDYYGDNPSKRKEITQMRDWWYKTANKAWQSTGVDSVTIGQLDTKINSILNQKADISELKTMLKDISDHLINNMTIRTATATTSGIVNTVATSSVVSHDVRIAIDQHCKTCGLRFGSSVKINQCPECGVDIN